jgi:NTE family protein
VPRKSAPSIGLVLGGGGARGLAHIVMLEVLDELGLRPKIIAGTSIGAIFGAAYAAGLSAQEIRAHSVEVLTGRFGLARNLIGARAQGNGSGVRALGRTWNGPLSRSALLAPQAVLDVVLPAGVPRDFSELEIPLKVVASDYYAMEPSVLDHGNLREAVAASMALPAVLEPVAIGGRTLIDGGLTNPLPFDVLEGEADILVAIDVSGVTVASEKRAHPTMIESLFASAFLFERSIIREKLKLRRPDIYIEAGTGRFQVLDFLRVREILAAALPAKEKLRAELIRVLGADALAHATPRAERPVEPDAREVKPKRKLLKRFRRPGKAV